MELGVRWKDRITNREIRLRANLPEELSLVIKRRRMRWLGHVLRMSDTRLPRTRLALMHGIDPNWRRPRGGVRAEANLDTTRT